MAVYSIFQIGLAVPCHFIVILALALAQVRKHEDLCHVLILNGASNCYIVSQCYIFSHGAYGYERA